MNHIYSVLWNRALGRFCVTSELGRSRSRATSRRHAGPSSASLPALVVLVALAWAVPAWSQAVMPQGHQVAAGSAQVTAHGNQMVVQQGTDKAILNWQSFNIGAGAKVTFQQPNAASVALNRVVGADASAIHGQLNANGKVFLVNPNGVLFGQGANVNVGGLVASTLNISNENFLKGNYQFNGLGSGLQGGSVINQGRITAAEGGAVALLGGTVSNQGTISARLGSVALAAGNQVSLDFAGDGLLNVQVSESAVNALAENQQLLQADGGSVLIAAKATDALLQTVVNNTGTVQARTVENREGKIVLLGGFNGGTARVSGTLDASAPVAGNGGFVDTSGANVRIETGTQVSTRAERGKTGTWLIDPTDLTISAGSAPQTASGIGAATLSAGLANNNVELRTVASGSEAGDIHVNASVAWTKNQLTLKAHGSININDVLSVKDSATGSGTLDLRYAIGGSPDSNLSVSGRVDFEKTGAGLLSVNGESYTVIRSLPELQSMQDPAKLGGRFALGGSIDASESATWDKGRGFRPIGHYENDEPFTGIFDGLGHTISNLTIDRPHDIAVGLFGYARNATLRNIALLGGKVVGDAAVGGLVGSNEAVNGNSNIYRIFSSMNVTGIRSVGGLVGENMAERGNSTITHSYTAGKVNGQTYVGGLVGSQISPGDGIASISNSYAAGDISSDGDHQNIIGGLVGRITSTTTGKSIIVNAYATGTVSGKSYVGGLVGINQTDLGGTTEISNTYATGHVTGDYLAGGLVGYADDPGSIAHSYWDIHTSNQIHSSGGQGLTSAQMKLGTTFASWDLSSQGASDATWRIYEGQTAPLLRSFMKQLTLADTGTQITREYNGTRIHAGATADLPVGVNANQVLGELSYTASSKNVGIYSGADLALSGLYSVQQGYDISYAHAKGSLEVMRKKISASVITRGKTYDGSRDAQVTGSIAVFAGDTVGIDIQSGRFDDKNVGQDKRVAVTASLTGVDASNYELLGTDSTASITAKKISGTIAARNKIYNGLTDAELVSAMLNAGAAIEGDDVAIDTRSGRFDNKNAGAGKLVIADGLTGNDAGNYTLVDTTTMAAITAKVLSGTILVSDKIYNGTTDASTRGTLDGVLSIDDVTFQTSGSFADRHAGQNKVVNVSGTLGGENAGNYELLSHNATARASIDKLGITGAITADGRIYNGTTTASTHGALDGALSMDNVTFDTVGSFADRHAGVNKTVTVSGTLAGENAGNYELLSHNSTTKATIDQATITSVSGITAKDRVYNAQTGVELLTASATLDGKVPNDDLSVASATGNMTDKHAGATKEVTITSITLGGDDARNYTLAESAKTNTTEVAIGKATITSVGDITATGRAYDGSTAVNLETASANLRGKVSGDQLFVTGATGTLIDKHAGAAKVVTITGITLDGADKGNYRLVDTTAVTTADITRRQLAAAASATKTYNGTDLANATLAITTGLVEGETLTAQAAGQSRFNSKNVHDANALILEGVALKDSDTALASNYEL